MIENWIQLTQNDAKRVFEHMSYPSAADLITWGGLLVILFFPLTSINRDDSIVGLSFCLFVAAATVILVLALPEYWQDANGRHLMIGFVYVGAAVLLAWLRFYKQRYRSGQQSVSPRLKTSKESGDGKA